MTRSIYEQTGWKRPYPKMLLMHDADLLSKISEYDYDMTDPDFIRYAFARGCMNGAFLPSKDDPTYEIEVEYWKEQVLTAHSARARELAQGTLRVLEKGCNGLLRRYVRDYSLTREAYFNEASDADNGLWLCIHMGRGHLQDCWEVYTGLKKSGKSEAPKQTVLF